MSSEPPPPPDPSWVEKEAERLVQAETECRERFIAFAAARGKAVTFGPAKTKEEWMAELQHGLALHFETP